MFFIDRDGRYPLAVISIPVDPLVLDRLKRYRLKGLKTKDGEFSTQNLVWRVLSRSNYIQVLKEKVSDLEKSYYRVKTPSLIQNEEFKMLIKQGSGIETIPQSILRCNRRLLLGKNSLPMLAMVKKILELFNDELFDVTETQIVERTTFHL